MRCFPAVTYLLNLFIHRTLIKSTVKEFRLPGLTDNEPTRKLALGLFSEDKLPKIGPGGGYSLCK